MLYYLEEQEIEKLRNTLVKHQDYLFQILSLMLDLKEENSKELEEEDVQEDIKHK